MSQDPEDAGYVTQGGILPSQDEGGRSLACSQFRTQLSMYSRNTIPDQDSRPWHVVRAHSACMLTTEFFENVLEEFINWWHRQILEYTFSQPQWRAESPLVISNKIDYVLSTTVPWTGTRETKTENAVNKDGKDEPAASTQASLPPPWA